MSTGPCVLADESGNRVYRGTEAGWTLNLADAKKFETVMCALQAIQEYGAKYPQQPRRAWRVYHAVSTEWTLGEMVR